MFSIRATPGTALTIDVYGQGYLRQQISNVTLAAATSVNFPTISLQAVALADPSGPGQIIVQPPTWLTRLGEHVGAVIGQIFPSPTAGDVPTLPSCLQDDQYLSDLRQAVLTAIQNRDNAATKLRQDAINMGEQIGVVGLAFTRDLLVFAGVLGGIYLSIVGLSTEVVVVGAFSASVADISAVLSVIGGIENSLISTIDDWKTTTSSASYVELKDRVAASTDATNNFYSVLSGAANFFKNSPKAKFIAGPAGVLIGFALNLLNTKLNNPFAYTLVEAGILNDDSQIFENDLDTYDIEKDKASQIFNQYENTLANAQQDGVCNPQPPPPSPPGGGGGCDQWPTGHYEDPNNIQGPQGFGLQQFVRIDQPLDYTINFENEPTATLPPSRSPSPSNSTPTSTGARFRLGSFGFGGMIFQVPANSAYYQTTIDLTQQFGYDVDVTATIDERTGIATWIFTTIDPATGAIPLDPTVGLLPPDDANGIGEGFVSYTVMADQADPTGTVINAQATVTFDTEPPLNTPQIFNTVDAGTGLTSAVATLPPYEKSTQFNVSWSGTDDTNGSAICNYTIYVSDDGGPFTTWLVNTSLTAAPFVGQDGHTYSFYSVATDNADNVQPVPTSAQASTTVDITTPTSSVDALPAFSPGTFTINWSGSNANGLAIASYDVYVSDDGGPFSPLLTNTTLASTDVTGVNGHTYSFYSIATDVAGKKQPAPKAAQSSTSVDSVGPTSTVLNLSSFSLPTFTVSWSGSDNPGGSGLATYTIYVSDNGGPFTPLLLDTTTTSVPFTGTAGHTYGFYSIAADNAGNVEATPIAAEAQTTVGNSLAVNSITAVSPNPRHTAVSSVDVTFSEPVDLTTFTYADLTLTDNNGGANLITSAVTISLLSGSTYQINGLSALTTANGTYSLTVNATSIKDQNGVAGANSRSTSWLMDTTAPTSHVVNSLGTSQTTDSFAVTVSYSDPTSGLSPASGVSSVDLYFSVNNGPFSLYQTNTITPSASGTTSFTFTAHDRNLYAFHSVAHDAAGNTENKSGTAVEASTTVPDLNPPVTHILASNPAYSWGSFPSSNFSSLTASSYQNGDFTINWAGADPDQNSGTPAGSITLANIYVQIDGGTPVLISQSSGGTPSGNGVYSGTLSYQAFGDGLAHTYSFFSVGVDDQQKKQYAPTIGPPAPDVTFSDITFTAPLGIQSFSVEKNIAERSFIQYLDVDFNQTLSSTPPSSALQALAAGLAGSTPSSYLELLYYGENLTTASMPQGSVSLFTASPTPSVSLSGNDLAIDFGPNGITSSLAGAPASPTSNTFGDGWYALGIDPSGNPQTGPTFWLTFFRLLGDTDGDGVVTGPYTTAGTDAYTVYHAEGQSGSLLNADVDGSGAVNSKDLTDAISAKGDAVGTTAPQAFPSFQLLAGPASGQAIAASITQAQVQSKATLDAALDSLASGSVGLKSNRQGNRSLVSLAHPDGRISSSIRQNARHLGQSSAPVRTPPFGPASPIRVFSDR